MTVRDFKEWISTFPEEFDDFEIVYSVEEYTGITDSDGDKLFTRKDFSINHGMVDEETKEVCIYNTRIDVPEE